MKRPDIKQALDYKGITITELAKRLNVTYNGARQLVTGAQTLASLEKVASAIGVDITDLFFEDCANLEEQGSNPAEIICPYCGKPISLHIEKKGSHK